MQQKAATAAEKEQDSNQTRRQQDGKDSREAGRYTSPPANPYL